VAWNDGRKKKYDHHERRGGKWFFASIMFFLCYVLCDFGVLMLSCFVCRLLGSESKTILIHLSLTK
jgi:small neutral amino acid transporter SnatA (MarC family)